MKTRSALLTLALALTMTTVGAGISVGEEPSGGSITFVAKNLIATADGSFHDWTITRASIDTADPGTSFVEVEVDIASVDTGNDRRDKHLRTADFFHVEKYPTARVRVHSVEAAGESKAGNPLYNAKFDLTIRDLLKTLPGQFELTSSTRFQVEGSLMVNRMDFEIGEKYNRWSPGSIKEDIPVHFSATLGAPPTPE